MSYVVCLAGITLSIFLVTNAIMATGMSPQQHHNITIASESDILKHPTQYIPHKHWRSHSLNYRIIFCILIWKVPKVWHSVSKFSWTQNSQTCWSKECDDHCLLLITCSLNTFPLANTAFSLVSACIAEKICNFFPWLIIQRAWKHHSHTAWINSRIMEKYGNYDSSSAVFPKVCETRTVELWNMIY
jgi:hypothetical protein